MQASQAKESFGHMEISHRSKNELSDSHWIALSFRNKVKIDFVNLFFKCIIT